MGNEIEDGDEDDEDDENDEEEQEEERNERLAEMRRKILEEQRSENVPSDSDGNLVVIRGDEEKEDLDFLDEKCCDDDADADVDEEKPSDGEERNGDEEGSANGEEIRVKEKKGKKKRNDPASSDIRYKVKKNLARRNKPKLKPNANKSRA